MKSTLININPVRVIRSRNLTQSFALGLIIFLLLVPTVYVLGYGFFNLSAAGIAQISDSVFFSYFSNSALVAGGAIATALVLGGIPAWLVQSYDFKGRPFASFLQLLPLTMPAYVSSAIYIESSSSDFFLSRGALALELGAAAAPWVYLFGRIALARVSSALADAATMLGLNRVRRFWRLYLPLIVAPLVAASALVGAEAVGDYGAASTVGIPTFSVGIYNQWLSLQRNDIGIVLAIVPILLAFIVLAPAAFFFFRRPLSQPAGTIRGMESSGIKGMQMIFVHLICVAAVLPGFLVPLVFSGLWAYQKMGRVTFQTLYGDAFNTLTTAVLTVAVCTAVTILASRLARIGERTGIAERSMWLVILNFLLPPIVLSFLLLKMSSFPFFQSTRLSIVVGESVRFLPLMLIPVAETLTRLPLSLSDSALTLGSTKSATFWRVLFPQLKLALAVGAILIFVESANELTMSLLLQPFNYSAIPLRIFYYSTTQMTRDASGWVICGILICSYPIWALSTFLDSRRGYHA
jgi:iron(III) transport system permease protein